MRKIVYFLLAAVLLAGCSTAQTTSTATPASGGAPTAAPATPTPDLAGAEIKPMPIDSVEVQIRESLPVQVSVLVNGSLTDGCTEFHEATQVRNGNTIELTVNVMRPKDMMCTQELTIYTNAFPLEGDFPPGDYIVRVNGVEKSFKI
jgi:inhibitor of cysteine peptidase